MSIVVSTAVGIFILVNFNTDAAKVAAAFLMPGHWGKYTSPCVLQPTTVGKLGMFPSLVVGRVAQSVYQLTTGWMVWDQILMGTRFSAFPDRPWEPPSHLYNGYWVFPRG
jgi:hypothetical protein